MEEPRWVKKTSVLAAHARQISAYGGASGIRDEGLLESALSRPQNLFFYGEGVVDLPSLAAAYAYGLANNHSFVDGNKRTALVVSFLFLAKNGKTTGSTEEDNYSTFMTLAAGELTEDALAGWFLRNLKEL